MADKVTMKQFSEKLGEYKNGSAARKAIGRFNGWSDEEKAKARKMIDAKFGPVDSVAPKAKAPKAKAPAKAVAKKAPAKAAKAAKAQRATRKATSPKGQMVGLVPEPEVDKMFAALAPPSMAHKRFVAERTIHVCAVAAQTAHTIHGDQPSLDLTAAWTKIIDTQNRALDLFSKELDDVELVEEKVAVRRPRAAKAAEPVKSNGAKEVSSDDAAFAAPVPAAPTQI
jgi:hypothetical protein